MKFRDFRIERREGKGEVYSTSSVTDRPFSNSNIVTKTLFKGKSFSTVTEAVPDNSPRTSPVPNGKAIVWTADSMRLVTPLAFPDADAAHDIRISLAKRE